MLPFKEELLRPDMSFPVEIFISDNLKETINAGLHFHECSEILFVLEGWAIQQVNSHKFKFEKHDMLLLNEGDTHSTHCEPDINTKILVIKFLPSIINSNTASVFEAKYIYAFMKNHNNSVFHLADVLKNSSEIYRVLLGLFKEYENKELGYEVYIKGYLCQLIACLVRNNIFILNNCDNEYNNTKIDKILKYIEKHYDEKIDLNSAAKILNLSASYFSRYFKKVIGRTFKEYIDFVRICEVEKEILSSDVNISEAAYKAGFNNISSFNRVYKRVRKYPPGVMKKSKTAK